MIIDESNMNLNKRGLQIVCYFTVLFVLIY